MKKRPFLAPLAVSIVALLGGTAVPTQAAVASEPSAVNVTKSIASGTVKVDQLVLVRSAGNKLVQTDHTSHASHSSHSSHSSHASGS